MTYKKAIGRLIEKSAGEWVGKVLKENGVDYRYSTGDLKEMYIEDDTLYYTVTVTITRRNAFGNLYDVIVEAGGTVCDIIGEISHSVIWDTDHNIIWMSVAETRRELGITELKIA